MNSQAATPIRAALDRALPLLDLLSTNPGPIQSATALRNLLLDEGVSQDDFAAAAKYIHKYANALAAPPKVSDGPVEEEQLDANAQEEAQPWLAQHQLAVGIGSVGAVLVGFSVYLLAYNRKNQLEWENVAKEHPPKFWAEEGLAKTGFTPEEYKAYKEAKINKTLLEGLNQLRGPELINSMAAYMGRLEPQEFLEMVGPFGLSDLDEAWKGILKRQGDETVDEYLKRIAQDRVILVSDATQKFKNLDERAKTAREARETRLADWKKATKPSLHQRGEEINMKDISQLKQDQRQHRADQLQEALEQQQNMILTQSKFCVTEDLANIAEANLNNMIYLNSIDLTKPCEVQLAQVQKNLFENQQKLNIIIQQNLNNAELGISNEQKQSIREQQDEFAKQERDMKAEQASEDVADDEYHAEVEQ